MVYGVVVPIFMKLIYNLDLYSGGMNIYIYQVGLLSFSCIEYTALLLRYLIVVAGMVALFGVLIN